eukprot:gene19895-biopygen20516
MAAVQQLPKQMSTLTVRVEEMEARGKAEAVAEDEGQATGGRDEDEITEALLFAWVTCCRDEDEITEARLFAWVTCCRDEDEITEALLFAWVTCCRVCTITSTTGTQCFSSQWNKKRALYGSQLGAGGCTRSMGGWAARTLLPRRVPRGCHTAGQLEFLEDEKRRCLRTGAWTRASQRSHASRVSLEPKPRPDKWRLVLNFPRLNTRCARSKCKMENPKKLLRLARKEDYRFSLDLKDGDFVLGIRPSFQRYMQLHLTGDFMQCSALLFGWNKSPRIFVKVTRVLVECNRAPQGSRDRAVLRKLRRGSRWQRWLVRRRHGRLGKQACLTRARVVPYMEDFLALCVSKAKALHVREMVTKMVHHLGVERNEKKGVWEPTQLVEHLGLEADTKSGQFTVTPQRIGKIQAGARHLLSSASRERRWVPVWELAGFNGLCQSVHLAVPPARF